MRWNRILRKLGHRTFVTESFTGGSHDLLIALHAKKSAASVERFRAINPGEPIVVALTGTDIYPDLNQSSAGQHAVEIADRLVLLQPNASSRLSPKLRAKAIVIFQSASPTLRSLKPLKNKFEVIVSGHLRAVKDPFRAALASRQLPDESRIQITHIGAARTSGFRRRAEKEMTINPRYRWRGELPRWKARQLMARGRLLVLSSRIEGGANVISEAVVSNLPVLASRISGNIGLLGEGYAGYFEYGDTTQLAELLCLAESSPAFYRKLQSECRALSRLFKPATETARWREILREIGN